MSLTYDESSTLMNNMAFRGRVKVACLKFAGSIFDEADTVPAHNTRLRWAQQVQQQPDMVAGQVAPPTVMDAAVQAAAIAPGNGDSTIDDNGLQGSVEVTVNKAL